MTRARRVGLTHHAWRKSSYSSPTSNNCVEVARSMRDVVAVRDSKDPEGPKLIFAPADWEMFTASVKAGGFGLG
jgi:uncharacterized Fe-S cluster-containing MiaB family protein